MSLSYGQRRSLAKRAVRVGRQLDAEAAVDAARRASEQQARVVERDAAVAARDAAAPCDVGALKPGDLVRDRYGWHRVVRVNAKSVTVATEYSWTDTIRMDRIVETRQAAPA